MWELRSFPIQQAEYLGEERARCDAGARCNHGVVVMGAGGKTTIFVLHTLALASMKVETSKEMKWENMETNKAQKRSGILRNAWSNTTNSDDKCIKRLILMTWKTANSRIKNASFAYRSRISASAASIQLDTLSTLSRGFVVS